MYSDFKGKAIEFVKEAVKEDEAGNTQKAFALYKSALEYFQTHLKYEKNPQAKAAITAKFEEYLARAEFLKKTIDEQVSDTAPSASSNATGVKAKPKGKDNKEDDEKEKLQGALAGSIVTEKPNVKWDDIAGLESAKDALKEAVVLPVKFPHFYTGNRKPWSGILLYGPPGTGKSYLAKAVATEADSTFFSVTASDLVSKWMGESEKLVANLFQLAREKAPSIVFLDEVDSLCSARGDNESEAARRIKTQFLQEMQGVRSSTANVLVLGATNLPYALDQAVRRRFEKRIYISLPEAPARAHMFKLHLGDTPNDLNDHDFQTLGEMTPGFSGSDCSTVVKDVLMQPIRLLRESTHFRQIPSPDGPKYVPCAPNAPGAKEMSLQYFAESDRADEVIPPPITMMDFKKSMLRAKPTVSKDDLQVFIKFTEEFGEEG